jgi:F-type H+-transporting ATPase subunit delta
MGRIANAYSKALFDQAKSSNQIDAIYADMNLIAATIEGSKELKNLLSNPIVGNADKKTVLNKIFAQTSEIIRKSLDLLCDKKRENVLLDVCHSYVKMYDQSKGINKIAVMSAIPLETDLKNRVKSYIQIVLKLDNVEMSNEVDANIIGGIIIKHEDKLLDLSVASELKRIRKEIIYN